MNSTKNKRCLNIRLIFLPVLSRLYCMLACQPLKPYGSNFNSVIFIHFFSFESLTLENKYLIEVCCWSGRSVGRCFYFSIYDHSLFSFLSVHTRTFSYRNIQYTNRINDGFSREWIKKKNEKKINFLHRLSD